MTRVVVKYLVCGGESLDPTISKPHHPVAHASTWSRLWLTKMTVRPSRCRRLISWRTAVLKLLVDHRKHLVEYIDIRWELHGYSEGQSRRHPERESLDGVSMCRSSTANSPTARIRAFTMSRGIPSDEATGLRFRGRLAGRQQHRSEDSLSKKVKGLWGIFLAVFGWSIIGAVLVEGVRASRVWSVRGGWLSSRRDCVGICARVMVVGVVDVGTWR